MIPEPSIFFTWLSEESTVKIILAGKKDRVLETRNQAWLKKIIDEFEYVNTTSQFFNELKNSSNSDAKKMWLNYTKLNSKLSGKDAKKNLRKKLFDNFNRVADSISKKYARTQYRKTFQESKKITLENPNKSNLEQFFNKITEQLKVSSPTIKYPYGQGLYRLFSNAKGFPREERTKLYSAYVKEFTSDNSVDNFLNVKNPTFGHVLFSFFLSEESGINSISGFTKGRGKVLTETGTSSLELEVWRKVESSRVKSIELPKKLKDVIRKKDINLRTFRQESLLDRLLLDRDAKSAKLDEVSAQELETKEYDAKTGLTSQDLDNYFHIMMHYVDKKAKVRRLALVPRLNSVNMDKVVTFGNNKSIRTLPFIKSLLVLPNTNRLFENSAKDLLSSGSFSVEQFENYFKTKNPKYNQFNDAERDGMLREFRTLRQESEQKLKIQQNLIIPKEYLLGETLDEEEQELLNSMDKIGDSYLATTREQKELYSDLKADFDRKQSKNPFAIDYNTNQITELSIVSMIELARKKTSSLKDLLNIRDLRQFEGKSVSKAEAMIISLFIINKILGVNIDKEVQKIDSLLPDSAQPLSGGTQSLEQAVNSLANKVETNLKLFQTQYIKALEQHLVSIVQNKDKYAGILTGKTAEQLIKEGLLIEKGGENDV